MGRLKSEPDSIATGSYTNFPVDLIRTFQACIDDLRSVPTEADAIVVLGKLFVILVQLFPVHTANALIAALTLADSVNVAEGK